MDSIFNTAFEMSLRILLLLSSDKGIAKTADMLALSDTIAIYGGAFDLSDDNLHGDIDFVLDEFDARRELVKQALNSLVLRGLITVSQYDDGFRYVISNAGQAFCCGLGSDYAKEYRQLAVATHRLINEMTEREVFAMINATAKRYIGR